MVCAAVPREVTGRRTQRVLVPVSVAYWCAHASAGHMLLLAVAQYWHATMRRKVPDAVPRAHSDCKMVLRSSSDVNSRAHGYISRLGGGQ